MQCFAGTGYLIPCPYLSYTLFFLVCLPSCISGALHSSFSASTAMSLGLAIFLLLRSPLCLWGSPFFSLFCLPSLPSYISEVCYPSSSFAFPVVSMEFAIPLYFAFKAISLGFILLLLLQPSQLYIWAPFRFFFFCVPSFISGVHHSSSSSAFPALSLGFTFLLFLFLLPSQLYLWVSPFFFFLLSQLCLWGPQFFSFCVPSFIYGVCHSSSYCAFPDIFLGFTIRLLLCSQLYLWGSPFFLFFFFFCVPSCICGACHSSFAFPAVSLGFTILILRLQLHF